MNNTICFFGATGGVTNACLAATLKSGEYTAIAMVRTPEKLKKQLMELQGLEESIIDERLTIVQGNAIEVSDVQNALLTKITANIDTKLPAMIVTGLGGAPYMKFNIWRPLSFVAVDNPTICSTAAKTVLAALKNIYTDRPALTTNKPGVTYISTTGITRGQEDVPLSMRFLYHQILAEPHVDKRMMEDVFCENMAKSKPLLSSVTGIRPTLLMGTGALKESVGIEKLRVGVESKPELGFTIQRADVGVFVFEKVIKDADGGKWRSEMLSLTA